MTLLVRSFVRSSDAERAAALGLVAVRGERVTALASRIEVAPSATEKELRSHAGITARIHDLVPSLPARFPTIAEGEKALANGLVGREADLAAALGRIGSRVELAITLAWREAHRAPATDHVATGRAYLEARAVRERERQEAERVAARFIDGLGYQRAFIRESICPRDGVAATVALLVPRGEVMRLRRDMTSARKRASEVTVTVHGPLAPFSFAS